MSNIIGNVEAIIAMYAPVVGTYVIQIIQWVVMWAKMKAQSKLQENIQKLQEDRLNKIDEVIELNRQLVKDNYDLKQKLNKTITLLQHYEEIDTKVNNFEVKDGDKTI